MPIRNAVLIGDVIVEFVSRAEVVIARPAVVTDMLLLVPAPLPALVVSLVGNVVVSLVGSVVKVREMRLILTVSAMAVVVVMTGARPCCTGSERQYRSGSDDDRSEPFRSSLDVSGHCNSSS
jgi:hypothetical protein